jgi:hypothetical protein
LKKASVRGEAQPIDWRAMAGGGRNNPVFLRANGGSHPDQVRQRYALKL